MAEMNDETIAHLKTVIEYSLHNERRHYEDMIEDMNDNNGEPPTGHVYISLSALHDWVIENCGK
jgi:hypothetical protein